MKYRTIFNNLLLAVSLVFLSSNIWAQHVVVKRIIEEGTVNNMIHHHLDILSNRIGGRPVGSDAYNAAVQWTASQFASWGLEVCIEEAGQTKVGFSRGPWSGKLYGGIFPGGDGVHLHFATPSYTSGTKGLQRGHVVIEPKTQAEFDRIKGVLKGAWVLISGTNTGQPIQRSAQADSRRDSIIRQNEEVTRHNNEVIRRYRVHSGDRAMNVDEMQETLKDSLRKTSDEPALFYRQMVEAGILGLIQSSQVPITALWDRETVFGELLF